MFIDTHEAILFTSANAVMIAILLSVIITGICTLCNIGH